MKKRNYELDFYRIIAALYVVILHSYKLFGQKVFIPYGSIVVEFFLITSGYFFALSVYKDKREFSSATIGQETWSFTWKKIKSFVYIFVLCYFITLAVTVIHNPKFLISGKFLKSIFDLLLLSETGLPFTQIIGADWYLSAMLIAMFVLYPFFRYKKDIFSHIVAPILGVGILGILFMKNGYVNQGAHTSMVIATNNVLRSISEICLGVVAYCFSEKLKALPLNKIQTTLLSVADLVCIIGAFTITLFMDDHDYQAVVILLFFVFITISTSGRAKITYAYKRFPCEYLGKLSLSLYLSHTFVRLILYYLKSDVEFLKSFYTSDKTSVRSVGLMLFVSLSIAAAIVMIPLSEGLKKLVEKISDKAKSLPVSTGTD